MENKNSSNVVIVPTGVEITLNDNKKHTIHTEGFIDAKSLAEKIAKEGFWQNDVFYPLHQIKKITIL